MIYFDTETCGLHGPIVLIQWAEDEGDINLYCPWNETIKDTIALIEKIVHHPGGICGFNLSFDWFHVCQMYSVLQLLCYESETEYGNAILSDHIDLYAELEPDGRRGPCLKPVTACDLMLHARKGPYQSTMNRDPIIIKRVPTAIAELLRQELDKRITFKDIYFTKQKDKKRRWIVKDIKAEDGTVLEHLKNIELKFKPSSALKALAADALDLTEDDILKYGEIEPRGKPDELGYAPFARALAKKSLRTGEWLWGKTWPTIIPGHITHWSFNKLAREYAWNDVDYTRRLYHFFGNPAPGDIDSILACMVGAIRWHGYTLNIDKIRALRDNEYAKVRDVEYNFHSHDVCIKYMMQVMSDTEKVILLVDGKYSTKKLILAEIAQWYESTVCGMCNGEGEITHALGGTTTPCPGCKDGFVYSDKLHPAAIRAREILDYRMSHKRIQGYDKLLQAGMFQASFNIIGTRSSRMSGSDGYNPQGVERDLEFRECFEFCDTEAATEPMILCGGDFDSFEVNIADAVYKDPVLHEELLQDKSIHALFGTYVFPGNTYEDIVASKKLKGLANLYNRAKQGVFAMLYGGNEHTLKTRVGIEEEQGAAAYQNWCAKYKVWGQERQKYQDMFCSMKQPGGIGSKVEWHEPYEYIESLFGFRRYFTLENRVCKALFDLANDPPKGWKDIKIKVIRRDHVQTACGAVMSALYAAAFALQAANMRAAGNHRIQSTGAQATKMLQAVLWEFQPIGIHDWSVIPFNVHDEIMCPVKEHLVEEVKKSVNDFIKWLSGTIPLVAMKWKTHMKSWADK